MEVSLFCVTSFLHVHSWHKDCLIFITLYNTLKFMPFICKHHVTIIIYFNTYSFMYFLLVQPPHCFTKPKTAFLVTCSQVPVKKLFFPMIFIFPAVHLSYLQHAILCNIFCPYFRMLRMFRQYLGWPIHYICQHIF